MRISTFFHRNLKDVISRHILQATSQFFSSNRRWGFSVRGYILAVSFPWALRGEDASSISKLAWVVEQAESIRHASHTTNTSRAKLVRQKKTVSVSCLGLPQLSVTVLHLEELLFGCQVHVEAEKVYRNTGAVSPVVQRATCNLRVQTSMQCIIWFSFCKVWTHFMCDLKISSAAHLPRPSSFDHGDPQSIGEDLHGLTMKRGYNNQKFEKLSRIHGLIRINPSWIWWKIFGKLLLWP